MDRFHTSTGTAHANKIKWAPSSEFVSSSIPSWQILTAHAQTFRGARDLAFCLKVPLDSLLVWASSEGSGETARMRRLAWTFADRIGDKYQIRWMQSKCQRSVGHKPHLKNCMWGYLLSPQHMMGWSYAPHPHQCQRWTFAPSYPSWKRGPWATMAHLSEQL